MRSYPICAALISLLGAKAQGAIPTFQRALSTETITLAGRDPAQNGTTTIPTMVVPIALSFEARKIAGKPFRMDATPDIKPLLQSPIFVPFRYPVGGTTQYVDAMLRATFPEASEWHIKL